jgi:hypothetical protein
LCRYMLTDIAADSSNENSLCHGFFLYMIEGFLPTQHSLRFNLHFAS